MGGLSKGEVSSKQAEGMKSALRGAYYKIKRRLMFLAKPSAILLGTFVVALSPLFVVLPANATSYTFSGQITASDSTVPSGQLIVRLTSTDNSSNNASTNPDSNGNFSINVAADTYTVSIYHFYEPASHEYTEQTYTSADQVDLSQTSKVQNYELPTLATITVNVQDAYNNPLPNDQVLYAITTSSQNIPSNLNPDGYIVTEDGGGYTDSSGNATFPATIGQTIPVGNIQAYDPATSVYTIQNTSPLTVSGDTTLNLPSGPRPSSPNVSVAVGSDGWPVISWSTVSGATGYRLYRNNVNYANFDSSYTSFEDKSAPANIDSYVLYSYNANGSSLPSQTASLSFTPPPQNITYTSPRAGYVELSWSSVPGATSYNTYRNGTLIGSNSQAQFTDTNAPVGTDTYYATAVSPYGESSPSSSVSVTFTSVPPTITYSASPVANSSGWNNSSVTVTFTCSSSGSSITSCSSPVTLNNEGANQTVTGTATDSNGNTNSVTTSPINIDETPPTLSTPTWTANPMTTTQTTTVTIPVSDNLSGVSNGEYYLGTTDPGQGNGAAMTYGGGNLTASYSNMAAGIYTVNFRAKDNAGNWSPVTTDYLVVYDTSKSSADGHSSDIEPIFGSDVLPGLIQTGQKDKEHFAFTVKYKNGALDPASSAHFDYKTGTNCNNPNKATNCHSTVLDASSFDWMIINGTNNSQSTIQGSSTLTIDGTTTTNPFRIITTDGDLLNPTTNDQFEIQIFAPGANPNTAQPLYYMNDPLAKGNIVVKS
jgi:hypothetical protein